MSKLIKLPEPFVNMWSLDESLYIDEFVKFVAAQGIDGAGAVDKHSHDDVTELIYLSPESVYGGLDEKEITYKGRSIVVPVGVEHGDLMQKSVGQWVSVKIDKSAKYLDNKSFDDMGFPNDHGATVAHSFETDKGLLVVAFSDGLIKLEHIIQSYSNRSPNTHTLIFPLIKSFVSGKEYPKHNPNSYYELHGRYLGVEFDLE